MQLLHSCTFFCIFHIGQFMKMGEAELCPAGKEITTQDECESALQKATELGITLTGITADRKTLRVGSWGSHPPGCSYFYASNQRFHFNKKETIDARNFLNGRYRLICKTGKTFILDAFCAI